MVKVNYGSNGNILGYYPDDIQYATIPEPCIEIDQTTHRDCIDNPGLRKVDTKTRRIVVVEPPVPTAEELKVYNLEKLDVEYQPQFTQLVQAIGLSTLDGKQTVIDSIKVDYATLKAEYQTKREAIING